MSQVVHPESELEYISEEIEEDPWVATDEEITSRVEKEMEQSKEREEVIEDDP